LQDRVVCLRQSPDTLFYRSVFPYSSVSPEVELARDNETLLWLKDYFQLDIDLVQLYNEWGEKDPVFARFGRRFEGIRMLRQDPWENLVSYASCPRLRTTRLYHIYPGLYVPQIITSPESRRW
jgi:N-glycosylase/DNA lyase